MHLHQACSGHISEIGDAEPPHTRLADARFQAWSFAEDRRIKHLSPADTPFRSVDSDEKIPKIASVDETADG
ncbi:hypothetical protein Pla52o_22390 [Novipirellula galeiformis]|uniref:Uncharacterized protein n=1 Tax=Novipirellula galeiformis TaxID=2528004 RepID=A0A5C6CJ08_9BACT|nr:hypothetical protein Pla52o_22390 [Novipirellula galeiformis]